MKIRVINFEEVTKHYTTYVDGKKEIQKTKEGFLQKIEPLRQEMESIIKAANSGLIVDQQSQQQRMEKFKKLQEEAIGFDNDFKYQFKEMNDKLNVKVYDELEKIINQWAKENDIDMVTGKMEVVYLKEDFDATNQILEVLKTKDLFVQHQEEIAKEKESV
jgi:Skp family chaperone for outer membrane proteins